MAVTAVVPEEAATSLKRSKIQSSAACRFAAERLFYFILRRVYRPVECMRRGGVLHQLGDLEGDRLRDVVAILPVAIVDADENPLVVTRVGIRYHGTILINRLLMLVAHVGEEAYVRRR